MNAPEVFIVDDDTSLSEALAQALLLDGYQVRVFEQAKAALERIRRDDYAVVVTDYLMPNMDGFELLEQVLEIDSAYSVIMMTGHGDVPMAVRAMQAGAYDFLQKPCRPQELSKVVAQALQRRRLTLENRALRAELVASDDLEGRLVGSHPSMVTLRERLRVASEASVDTLIVGRRAPVKRSSPARFTTWVPARRRVRGHHLRGDSCRDDRVRTLWTRSGRFHGSDQTTSGSD